MKRFVVLAFACLVVSTFNPNPASAQVQADQQPPKVFGTRTVCVQGGTLCHIYGDDDMSDALNASIDVADYASPEWRHVDVCADDWMSYLRRKENEVCYGHWVREGE